MKYEESGEVRGRELGRKEGREPRYRGGAGRGVTGHLRELKAKCGLDLGGGGGGYRK